MASDFDDFQLYLSGAGSHGGAQADPHASFGNYRSSTELKTIGTAGNLRGGTISKASGIPGAYSLEMIEGSAKARISKDGEGGVGSYKIVTGGPPIETYSNEAGIRFQSSETVKRTCSLNFIDLFNNVFDDVSDAERSAGDTEYRCIFLVYNGGGPWLNTRIYLSSLSDQVTLSASYSASGAVTITGSGSRPFQNWPRVGYVRNRSRDEVLYYTAINSSENQLTIASGGRAFFGSSEAGVAGDLLVCVSPLEFAIEEPSSQPSGFVQTIANESTTPTGLSWQRATLFDDPEVQVIPDVFSKQFGLWLKRKIPASGHATPNELLHLEIEFY